MDPDPRGDPRQAQSGARRATRNRVQASGRRSHVTGAPVDALVEALLVSGDGPPRPPPQLEAGDLAAQDRRARRDRPYPCALRIRDRAPRPRACLLPGRAVASPRGRVDRGAGNRAPAPGARGAVRGPPGVSVRQPGPGASTGRQRLRRGRPRRRGADAGERRRPAAHPVAAGARGLERPSRRRPAERRAATAPAPRASRRPAALRALARRAGALRTTHHPRVPGRVGAPG